MMKRWQWLGVSMTYVGTVIGAGFASGQEIWQFFSRHGPWGTAGIVFAGLCFLGLGYIALEFGRSGIQDFSALFRRTYGRASVPLEYITTLLLALGVGVVAVGGGTALHLILNWPEWTCSLIVLAGVMGTVLLGGQAVVRANSIVVPYLLALTLIVGLWPVRQPHQLAPHDPHGWWLSALLYVSYNLFTAMMALLGLGPLLSNSKESWWASGTAALVLTAMALLEHRVLVTMNHPGSLPMLLRAGSISGTMRTIFGVSLLAAMYTTGIGEAFALATRYGKRRIQWLWLTAVMIGWPFQTLVASIYPILGVVSVAFWLPLVVPSRRGS